MQQINIKTSSDADGLKFGIGNLLISHRKMQSNSSGKDYVLELSGNQTLCSIRNSGFPLMSGGALPVILPVIGVPSM